MCKIFLLKKNLLAGLVLGSFLLLGQSIYAAFTVDTFKMVGLQSANSATPVVANRTFFIFASLEMLSQGDLENKGILSQDGLLKPYFFPNPFYMESGSTLGYELNQDMDIQLRIYNMAGYEIFQSNYLAGTMGGLGNANHQFYNKIHFDQSSFRGHDLSSGIYLFVLINNNKVIQKGKFAVKPGRLR
ncbi:MAG: T9SS type A sorting domain-containing protein [Candidatus Margulisbacteria bacterium]|nr:T9SS type A sorting domain-containing protein [Candidatus Margulisiibacteriota bacterium]